MTEYYNIETYFQGKSLEWARKADSREYGGNCDGKLNNNEIQVFKEVVKYRYEGYEYDFSKTNIENEDGISNYRKDNVTQAIKVSLFNGEAAVDGLAYSYALRGATSELEYAYIGAEIEAIADFPIKGKRDEAVKDFLRAYNNGSAKNGFFEQMASEWGSGITNKQATLLLKTILDSVPEGEKRYCDEYGTIYEAYQHYASQPEDKKFKNSPVAFFTRLFGADRLDNLDEAIKKVYKK